MDGSKDIYFLGKFWIHINLFLGKNWIHINLFCIADTNPHNKNNVFVHIKLYSFGEKILLDP